MRVEHMNVSAKDSISITVKHQLQASLIMTFLIRELGISYVWGTSNEVRRIIVDGQWIHVTLNLFHALQHFRLKDSERTLWADAICIQQTNPPEKGRQVQLMGQIYENSTCTLVWLGMDHEGIAVETTNFLKRTSKTAAELCEVYGSVVKIPTLSREENPISQDQHDWDLFKKFIGFKWFTRTWVSNSVSHSVTHSNSLIVSPSQPKSAQKPSRRACTEST